MRNSQYIWPLFQWIVNGTIKRNNFILIGCNTVAWRTWVYFSSISFNTGEKHAFTGWLNKSREIRGNSLFENRKIIFVDSVSQHSYWTGESAFVSTRLRNLLFCLFLQHTTLANYSLQCFFYRCELLEKQLNFLHQTLTMQVHYCLWKISIFLMSCYWPKQKWELVRTLKHILHSSHWWKSLSHFQRGYHVSAFIWGSIYE